jgi:hypothetical protein
MEQLVLLTGMSASETAYASMFARYRYMTGQIRLDTLFLNANQILHESQTVSSA